MVQDNFFVIDAHCHIYPEKIVSAAVNNTDRFYDVKSACVGTVDDLIKQGSVAGIDGFIVQSVATTPHQVTRINEFIAAEVLAHKDKLIGLGTLHPESTDIKGDLEHLKSLELKGVKLHPDIQGFKIDDYRCLKIYEHCENMGVPILMHTGDCRYDNSNPNRLMPILKIFSKLKVIGAHFGGWSIWQEAAEKMHNIDNLYVDCSSSFPYLEKQTAKKIIETYGVDRVLFGTDYPMWSPKKELDYFLSLEFNDNDKRKILSENVKKLFELGDFCE